MYNNLKTFEISAFESHEHIVFNLPLDANIIDIQFYETNMGTVHFLKFVIVYITNNEVNLSNYKEGTGFEFHKYVDGDSIPDPNELLKENMAKTIFEKTFIIDGIVCLIRINRFYSNANKEKLYG